MSRQDPFAVRFWVVYFNPTDFPGKVVVRGQVVTGQAEIVSDKETLCVVEHLVTAREAIAGVSPGATWFPREAHDDRCIVECWMP